MITRLPVRVRFAPSPTGHLHIGGLRTALFNWLFARKQGGTFLLRIEDTDRERSTEQYRESIFQALTWAGIASDEPVVTQSERFDFYQSVVEQLLKEEKVYRCYCTPESVVLRTSPITVQDETYHKYDGFCRQFIGNAQVSQKPYVIRFKIPDASASVTFDDSIRGPITINVDQLDDFIIVRADGMPMYNFVVVVDDADMKITHVIRGEDHISNTPKQILLYQACGYAIPQFAHLPLILGASGNRLSKRDAATSVLEYRSEGYLASALINYLVRLGWSYKDQEVFSISELVSYFSLENVGKKGAIFDIEKLKWLNQIYMKAMNGSELYQEIVQHIDGQFGRSLDISTIYTLLDIYKKRCHTLRELCQEVSEAVIFAGADPGEYRCQWIAAGIDRCLHDIAEKLDHLELFNLDSIKQIIDQSVEQYQIKMIQISQPVRFALIGKIHGPGILELMNVFGKRTTLERIHMLINYLQAT